MWEYIDSNNVEYKIIYAKKRGKGKRLNVEMKAIPSFFDVMDNSRIYEEYNEHMTAMSAFAKIFEDMPFSFILVDSFDAVEWEGFGAGESRLETFKRALERYKCEFRIVGNTVYLERQIGRDTNFIYRYQLNASNIVKEIDANECWTYAKGYGDYEDGEDGGWENANLEREYTSPLAKILGVRHAPPIKDGRISRSDSMDDALKELVDESIQISITTDIHDLRKQGYALAQPEIGDRVFIIDERIGLNEEVRVVAMKVKKNWRGDILDLTLTIGDEGVTKRYQSNLKTAVDALNNWVSGREKVPSSILDDAVRNATKLIQNANTELKFPNSGGIIGVDPNNPNHLVSFTSKGIGVSTDGGVTMPNAITGEGVVAESIIGQSIIGVNLSSVNEDGYFAVHGSDAEFYDVTNGRRVTISASGLYGYNRGGDIRFQADSALVTSSAFGTSNGNVYLASQENGEARVVRYSSLPGGGSASDYSYRPIRSQALKSPPTANAYVGTDGELRVMSEGLAAAGTYRDVRANHYHGNALITRGDVAYVGVDTEMRVMDKNLNNFRDIRGQVFIGTRIRLSDSYNATHFYIQTSNGGEVRVTGRTGTDSYRPVRAQRYLLPDGSSAMAVGTFSTLAARPTKNEGTAIINGVDLLRYTDNGSPAFKLNGKNIALDDVVANLVKSNQEMSQRLDTLEA